MFWDKPKTTGSSGCGKPFKFNSTGSVVKEDGMRIDRRRTDRRDRPILMHIYEYAKRIKMTKIEGKNKFALGFQENLNSTV